MLTSLAAEQILLHGVTDFSPIKREDIPAPQSSPGRFEQMTLKKRRFIFIGAHNLDGLRVLVQSIYKRVELDVDSECLFALSERPDDEINSILEVIISCNRLSRITKVCSFKHPRALNIEKLSSLLESRKKAGKEELKFVESWKKAINKSSSNKTLILGSYYFISEVQKYLLGLGADFKS